LRAFRDKPNMFSLRGRCFPGLDLDFDGIVQSSPTGLVYAGLQIVWQLVVIHQPLSDGRLSR